VTGFSYILKSVTYNGFLKNLKQAARFRQRYIVWKCCGWHYLGLLLLQSSDLSKAD